VATILLLALTVTLFASIFAWVTAFPAPPPQNNNQFQASLRPTANLTYVNGISITHLAGPSVAGTGQIYLSSSTQPTAPEFANPYSISSGLGGAKTWNLGQVWNLTFPLTQMPRAGGNITVYVVVSYQLLFSVILPGTTIAPPPSIVATFISPATPNRGQAFTVFATVTGSYTPNSVYVNLAAVPVGLGMAQQMTLNQGEWTYLVSGGATTNGTYYGFVNATSSSGQVATGAVVITIAGTGGSSGPLISVGVVAIPQPPTVYVGTNYFAAVITYSGSLSGAALNVSFWTNQTPHSPFQNTHFSTHLNGPNGLTISGPSTVTVYSTWPVSGAFSAWLLNSSAWLNASASIAGAGSASGSNFISSPNYVQGLVYSTTTNPSHSCTLATTCPFVYLNVWDNWTAALGGPASLTFSGKVFVNISGGGGSHTSYTISSTSVSPGTPVLNLDAAGGTTRWKPAQAGAYTLTMVLTVLNGATVVGYVYDTFTGTAS